MIAIIVPTVNRPHLLEELLASIHRSTQTPHTVYFMVEVDDHATLDALTTVELLLDDDFMARFREGVAQMERGELRSFEDIFGEPEPRLQGAQGREDRGPKKHHIILGRFGSYTASAIKGVSHTREPFFLVANDDVIFHPGWDEAALSVMRDPVRVVGIDQGNGRTDCFFLVDRRYLTEQGGTPDGRGEFYHPGYLSQYVDTEFVELAKMRGVWAEAPGALIEHRHWTLGKSDVDANYQLAIDSVEHDRRLYEDRRRLWAA